VKVYLPVIVSNAGDAAELKLVARLIARIRSLSRLRFRSDAPLATGAPRSGICCHEFLSGK
jgi:hypothetical protein